MSLQAGPSLVRSGMRVPDPAPMHGMQPGASLFRGVQHSEVPPPDAHERNAMIGHTLELWMPSWQPSGVSHRPFVALGSALHLIVHVAGSAVMPHEYQKPLCVDHDSIG